MRSITASTGASSLPIELQAVCNRLGISVADQITIADLEDLYKERTTASEIIVHVKNGIRLPVVAECLRLQDDIPALDNTPIKTINAIVKGVGFSSTSIDELNMKPGHTLVRGQSISPRDYIRMRRDATRQKEKDPVAPASVLYAPHDLVIEPLVEAIRSRCGEADPGESLAQVVKRDFDRDYILAYNMLMEDENMFFKLIGLERDQDPDRITTAEDGDDLLHNLTVLGLTPGDLGLGGSDHGELGDGTEDPDELDGVENEDLSDE